MLSPSSGCGFGGGALIGERAVRITCLDEAGVSNPEQEPYLVVAGVMIEPDRRYGPLDMRLRSLAEEYLPADLLEQTRAAGHPFVFQAKHVWHGEGAFPRDDEINWYLGRRMKVFNELSKIPEKFSLNIVWAALDRQAFLAANKDRPAKDLEGMLHAGAYFHVMRKVDSWMIENAPREYTLIFAEDRPEVRSYIEMVHAMSTDRSLDENAHPNAFGSTHIAEPVAFVKKHRSAVLQVADHCAFIIKRKLRGCKHIQKYYANIEPMIWSKSTDASNLCVKDPWLLG
jgi:hypothetical protein